jgi:hypothetical protein
MYISQDTRLDKSRSNVDDLNVNSCSNGYDGLFVSIVVNNLLPKVE